MTIEIKALASSSSGNCYHVTDGKTPLLLECGLRYKDIQRGLNFKMADIEACLISHEHLDHCKAHKEITRAGIDCYMTRGTAEALGASGHRINIVEPKKQFQIGTWTVLPFDTVHDAQEPVGYLLANRAGDKVLFATDTFYLRYKFKGLTHIMIECNHDIDTLRRNVEGGVISVEHKNRLLKNHFSLGNVKEFLKFNDLSRVQEIWLLHLSDDNSDAARFKDEIQQLTGKIVYVAQS